MGDPYAVVHAEVERQLADAGTAILRWRQAAAAEREAAAVEVRRILDEVAVDLADLEEMVEIAPSPADARARAAFLSTSQRSCRELRDEVEGREQSVPVPSTAKGNKDQKDRAELLRSDGAHAHAAPTASLARRDAPIEAVLQQELITQREEVRFQDVELGQLSGAVVRLGEMGRTINQELRTQGTLIDDLDREVDDAGTQMRSAMVVMKKMLKNKDRGKFCAIFVLTIVLIILTMAVFSF